MDGLEPGKGLALTAPGVDIVGADNTMSNGYGKASGTSDATAYVSAAAALVRSEFPDLSAGQVINRLLKSATLKQHEGLTAPDEEYGYGVVRPYSALTMDIPWQRCHVVLDDEARNGEGTAVVLRVSLAGYMGGAHRGMYPVRSRASVK